MPLPLLLVLVLACLPQEYSEPLLSKIGFGNDPFACAVWTWGGIGLIILAAAWIARRTSRGIYYHPDQREAVLHYYSKRRFYHLIGLFLVYGVALFILGWGWAVEQLWNFPGNELLTLAPFLVGLVGSWAFFYRADQALHETASVAAGRPFWSRWGYVNFHLRQNLAFIAAPLLLMIAVKALQRWFPDEDEQNSELLLAVVMGMLVAVFVTFPWILRLVLGLRPLPEGPLRDRLLAAARRLHFRFSNILLWNTHSGVANAMVAGILPLPRYVLLSDRLVQELSPEEIEAVFGHEVGHIKYRHMIYYVGFMSVSMLAVACLWSLLVPHIPALQSLSQVKDDWAKVPLVGLVGVYVFVVFGFLSRRCERQADIFGCRAVSCDQGNCKGHAAGAAYAPGGSGLCATGILTFISALEKVADVNNISRSKPGWFQSWQHSTIARRVEFLRCMAVDPTLEPRFQRTVRWVKWGLVLALVLVLVLLSIGQGWESIRPT
jgi:Zn-dependent protease with chaperone function